MKFGHLICFDILFEEPTASLLAKGVTNFVFPSQWYSELPFLTATQVQQGWAHSKGINLLAAGMSEPGVGSSGTGIYGGHQGALKRHFSGSRGTVTLMSVISKVPGRNHQVKSHTEDVHILSSPILLFRENFENYSIVPLFANNLETLTQLCHEEFCCSFEFKLTARIGDAENNVSLIYFILNVT